MGLGARFFAATYDLAMAGTEKAGFRDQRRQLLAAARGRVLEIGAGTGANLSLYGAAVTSLTLTEPEPPMVKRLQRHVQQAGLVATVLRAPAEDLPFDDDSFDTVVSTLVLCTVDDQPRAVRELLRVLRPDGIFLLAEHIRSDEPKLARLQDRMNGLGRVVAHGCNCNRPTLDVLQSAGFEVVELERDTLKKVPPFMRPLVVGTAIPKVLADRSGDVRL